MRILFCLLIVFVLGMEVLAQTDTPTDTPSPTPTDTPTITPTNTDQPSIYQTLQPLFDGTSTPVGQMTRFDYTATAGDVQISNLLYTILLSMWGFFTVWVLMVLWRKK